MRTARLLAEAQAVDLGLPLWNDLAGPERAVGEWLKAAHAPQEPPPDPWRTWVLLGGRGSGKTRAGAEWLADQAARLGRVALVGPTLHDVRSVMIEGPSGLRWLPNREPPRYHASLRRLDFPGGAVAYAFSAEDPDSLRGPQFAAAWADEFCAWPKGEAVLANLRLGLRTGPDPRLVVTTTPRPLPALRRLLAEPTTVRKDAPTSVNAEHLSPGFLEDLQRLYGGTRLAAQELEGRIVDAQGSLWRVEDFVHAPAPAAFDRCVVAVDPPASQHGAACGIVVVGRADGRAYVLADLSQRGLTPGGWAARVAGAVERWGAGAVVAEANQGGDMVRSVLETAGVRVPVRAVHAQFGKVVRAEPVAQLYEQGRVLHCTPVPQLEEELLAFGAEGVRGPSPDRADALVWAVTDLLLDNDRWLPRISIL